MALDRLEDPVDFESRNGRVGRPDHDQVRCLVLNGGQRIDDIFGQIESEISLAEEILHGRHGAAAVIG